MTFCGKGQHIRAPAVRDTEGFVGVAVGDWQGGLSAATGAGYRKRASKEADGWLIFLPQAKNKSEQSGLCSDVASLRGFEPPTYRLGGGRSIRLSYSDIYHFIER